MIMELEAVEKAILELQSGKRVASVRYGDSQVQYASTNINELLQLRDRLKVELKNKRCKGPVIFSTTKGL